MASLLLQPPKIPSQEAEVSEGRWESHPYASLYDQVLSAHPDAVVSNAMTPNSNSKTGPAIPAVITSMGFPSPNIINLPMRDDSDDSPTVVPLSSSASSTSETDSSYDDDDDDEEEEDDDVIALLRNGNLDIHHLELDDDDDDEDDDEDDDDAISVHTIDSMETIDFVPSCAKSSELHVVGSSYPSSEDASTSIYPKKRARPNESLATTVSTINTTTTTSQPKKTPSSFDAALLPPMKKFKAVSSSSSCVPTTTNLNLHGNFEMKLMMEARQHQYKQMVEALERRKCMFASMRLRLEQEELQTNLRQKQFLLCLLRQENERLLEMKKAMKGEKKPKKKGSLDATRSSSPSSSPSSSSSKKARKSKKNDARWMTMFERLKVYKKHHGNTLVPVRYKDRQLGEWVRQQRRRCKRPERTKMLEDIGFVFIVRPNQGHWFDMYQKLVDYKRTHNGHTNVPMGDKNYPELAEWVSRQRMLYRHWGISRHRRDLLERIGFKLTDNK
mmetsp:Transcript_32326/g.76008  ORF Transcript_32326/g.76008 Transcript_32326/m.76008 type:complete len:500 (+) Transcript_32326:786-2285(+)